MIRSRLKNRFYKTRSDQKTGHSTKHKERLKMIIFSKVNPKLVSDNKIFWQTIKPYFSDKKTFQTKFWFHKINHPTKEKKIIDYKSMNNWFKILCKTRVYRNFWSKFNKIVV